MEQCPTVTVMKIFLFVYSEASCEAMKLFNEVKLMSSLIALFMMERAEHDLILSVGKSFTATWLSNSVAQTVKN